MFEVGYTNNSLPNHLLHLNKYGIFVQRIHQLHTYAGKFSGMYLNLVFFFPILSSYVIGSFILARLYLLSNYVNQLLYAFYFRLRGLQVCSLVTLLNI